MNVLVTGATGFLGTHVLAHLATGGHRVTALGSRDGDLANPIDAARLLSAQAWDVIVNLAGPVTGGAETPAVGIDVITAHVNIALNVRKHAGRARIVHASSMTVYGMPETVPVTENHPRRPRHLYATGKRLAEDVLLTADADVCVLRLPGLFSETRASGALFHFCRAARQGETLRVSAPEPTPWDILHVDDAARGVLAAVTASGAGGPINLGYDEPVELTAIARAIAGIAGTGSSVENTGATHPVFQLATARARALLGWAPPTLEARLTRLYADYGAR